MATYRMRTTATIQAAQWWPPGDPRHDPSMLTVYGHGDRPKPGDLYLGMKGGMLGIGGSDVYMLRTTAGNVRVSPGDWITTSEDGGERWAIKPDRFRATYVPVLRVHGPIECDYECSLCDDHHHWIEACVSDDSPGDLHDASALPGIGDPILECKHCFAWAEYPDWWGDDEDAEWESLDVRPPPAPRS